MSTQGNSCGRFTPFPTAPSLEMTPGQYRQEKIMVVRIHGWVWQLTGNVKSFMPPRVQLLLISMEATGLGLTSLPTVCWHLTRTLANASGITRSFIMIYGI